MWTGWWLWLIAGVALAVLEMLAPAFVLLGFSVGAFAVGLVFWVGGPFAATLAGSLPLTLVFFAAISLVAWLGLRHLLGHSQSQVKTFHRDINED